MTYFSLTFVLLIMLTLNPALVVSENITDVKNLRATLLSDYHADIRPPMDHTKAVEVNLTFRLIAIQDFDEVKGLFSTIGVLDATWKDDRLEWLPNSHGSIATILFKKKDIWVPDLMLGNAYTNIDIGRDVFPLRVFPDGTVFWSFGDVMKTICSADFTYFPFDVQICDLQIGVWGNWYEEVKLVSTLSVVPLEYYPGHGEWTITGTRANVSLIGESTVVNFFFEMEREPLFFMLNLAVPVSILGLINPFVFALAASSGERISYAVTNLLSVSVYLTLVSEMMPTSSNPMAKVTYGIVVQFILSSLVCICSIYTMHLYDSASNERPIPTFLKQTICMCSCKSSPVEPIITDDAAMVNVAFELSECSRESQKKSETLKWDDVCSCIDRLFFISFLVSTSLVYVILGPCLYFQGQIKQL